MLTGIARKIAIPFLLLSIVGWILFCVGFGIRNFAYKEASEGVRSVAGVVNLVSTVLGSSLTIPVLDNAAKPEFILFWMFAGGGLLVYILSFLMVFWEHCIPKFLVNIVLPVFIMGAGGVLLMDGLMIYRFYQAQKNNGVVFFCTDIYLGYDVNGNEYFASIEFAGLFVSVFFYWVFMMISSFFISKSEVVYK